MMRSVLAERSLVAKLKVSMWQNFDINSIQYFEKAIYWCEGASVISKYCVDINIEEL